jgi:hypothetical protein
VSKPVELYTAPRRPYSAAARVRDCGR